MDINPGSAVFFFLAVGSIALFSFLAVAAWAGSRSDERKAYYKNDMLKKLAESTAGGATAALDYLREQQKITARKKRGELQLGGLVLIAVGVALMVFLAAIVSHNAVFLVGLIPLLIGVALFGYAQFMMSAE